MPVKTIELPDGKKGVEVSILESSEKWSEFTFEDGTVMRAKLIVAGAARVVDEYDEDGNPVYALQASPAFALVKSPDELKLKSSKS